MYLLFGQLVNKNKLLNDRWKAVLLTCNDYNFGEVWSKSLRSYQNDIFGFFLSFWKKFLSKSWVSSKYLQFLSYQKSFWSLSNSCSTVVEHLTTDPETEGSNLASYISPPREKNLKKKCFRFGLVKYYICQIKKFLKSWNVFYLLLTTCQNKLECFILLCWWFGN